MTSTPEPLPLTMPRTKMLRPSRFWQIAEPIAPPLSWLFFSLSIGIPLILWALISNSGWVEPLFLPTPQQVGRAAQGLWASGDLPKDIVASVWRISVGFLLAAIISIPLGVIMGTFASIRALLEPIIGIIRYMPAPAFIPLLILYFGIGEAPKIILIFIGVLFFNTLMVMDSVKFVPKELIETTYTLGGNRWQTLFQVIFPYVTPNIIDACRVNLAAAWQLVIVAELIAATEGLGRRISVAGRFLKTDEIFVGLIVIGIIGLAIDLLFRLLLRTTCHWASK